MKVKVICAVHGPRSGEPGQQSHRDHQRLLHAPSPTEIAAEHRGGHHAEQIQNIYRTLNLEPLLWLNLFSKSAWSRDIFSNKDILIVDVEDQKESGNCSRPDRNQRQGPMKRHATQ